MTGRRRGWAAARRVASVLLPALLVAVAIHQWPRIAVVLGRSDPGWLAVGFGCYLVNYGLRGLRFRVLARGRVAWWPGAVRIAMLHGAAAYLMPVRSGDAALPVLLRTYGGMPLGEGVRLLAAVRLLDLSSLGLWVVGAMSAIPAAVPPGWRAAWLGCGLVLVASPVLARAALRLASRRVRVVARHRNRWDFRLEGWQAVRLLGLSAAIWGAIGGCLYAVARGIGLPLGFADVWFLVSAQLPLQLIPLQGVGNAGNHEVGWVAALGILGVPAADALGFALSSHAVLLGYVLVLGGIGLCLPRGARSR